jgi:hypothetical protein
VERSHRRLHHSGELCRSAAHSRLPSVLGIDAGASNAGIRPPSAMTTLSSPAVGHETGDRSAHPRSGPGRKAAIS